MAPPPNLARKLELLWPALLDGDPEAVHRVRKLTRRAQAHLRVSRSPGRTRRAWRELRQMISPIRDRDVTSQHLLETLRAWQLPQGELRTFRQKWARARREAFAALTFPQGPPEIELRKYWKRHARDVLERDREEMQREGVRVLDSEDPEDWHSWRKQLKRYRYTLELVGKVPGELEEVLQGLGRMQDAQVIREVLAGGMWLPAYRERLLEREGQELLEARAQVRTRWPALQRHLRR